MNRRIATLALTSAALLSLTSCAGFALPDAGSDASEPPSDASTQSVVEACAAVQEGLGQAGEALGSLGSSDATANPEQTIALFSDTLEMLGTTIEKIGNADVLAATTAVHTDFTAVSDTLNRLLIDKDPLAATAVPGVVGQLQGSVQKLGALCAP